MRAGWKEMLQRAPKQELLVELAAAQDEAEDLREACIRTMNELTALKEQQADLERRSNQYELEAKQNASLQTKTMLEQALLETENKRLKNRVQQLENALERIKQ